MSWDRQFRPIGLTSKTAESSQFTGTWNVTIQPNKAMHAELRRFVFHTLQRRSPQPGDRGRYVGKIAPSMTLDETITAYTTQWPYRDFGGQEMAMLLGTCNAAIRQHDLHFSTSHTTLWIIREFEKQKQPPSKWIGVFTDGSSYELCLSSRNSQGTINENRTAHTKPEDAAETLGRFITELVS